MKTSDVLREAAKFIANKKRWTCFVTARNCKLVPVDPRVPGAHVWCAVGALVKIIGEYYTEIIIQEFRQIYGADLADTNDSKGHAGTIGAMMWVADKLDGL